MTTTRSRTSVTTLVLALLLSKPAQALEVTAELLAPVSDAGLQQVRVGEPFHVILTAKHAPGEVALLPADLDLGGAFTERRSARKHDRSTEAAQELDRYTLELIAFEPGEKTIPAIPLAAGSTTASSQPLTLTIASGLEWDEQQVASSTLAEAIAELEKMAAPSPNPRPIEVPDRRPLYVIGALIAAALLALAVIFALKNRKKFEAPLPPPPPPRPAHEVAMERLSKLQRSDYLAEGDHKTFHVELSEALREYVGARFGFDSIELTVSELFAELEKRSTPHLDRTRLKEILQLSDLVKFAKLVPEIPESKAALDAAIDLVTKTTPAVTQEVRA